MPGYQAERESRKKVVEIGEWFKPFLDYDVEQEIPYVGGKSFHFFVTPIGEFSVDTVPKPEIGLTSGTKLVVILPSGEETIDRTDISGYKDKLGSRLFHVSVMYDGEKDLTTGYQVEIRSPNDQVYTANFDKFRFAFDFSRKGDIESQKFGVVVSEDKNTLENLQVRIAPKEENAQ